jgi:hypothetical protein
VPVTFKTTTMTEELMGMIIGVLMIGGIFAYVSLSSPKRA